MTTGDKTLSTKLDQVAHDLNGLSNTLGRIDERLEIFVDKQRELESQLDDHIQNCPIKCHMPEYLQRLAVVESVAEDIGATRNDMAELRGIINTNEKTVQKLATSSESHEGHWKSFKTFIFNVVVYVVGVAIAAGLLHLLQVKGP